MDRSAIATFEVDGLPSFDGTPRRFRPGVTSLADDAADRSLLLSALRTCLGTGVPPDEALVGATLRLTVDGSTSVRSVERRDGTVVADGEAYLDDSTVADEYAYLLGSTVADPSIGHADALRELLFGPTAVTEKAARLDRVRDEVAEINQRLATMASAESELPTLTERRASLADHCEGLADRLDDTMAELRRRREATPEAAPTPTDDALADVRRAREAFREVRRDVHDALETIESLCEERRSIREDRQALGQEPAESVRRLEARLADHRRERERLQRTIRQLGSVIELADGLLHDEGTSPVLDALADANCDGPADATAADDLVCWTCGSAIAPEQVHATKDTLEAVRAERIAEMNDLDAEIESLEREKADRSADRDRRGSLEQRREEVEAELAAKRDHLEELRHRRSALVETIDAFEETYRSRADSTESELLGLERTANRQALELHRTDTDWETLTERIHDVLDRLGTRAELVAERTRKTDRRSDLAFEIDRIEATVVDRFNAEIEALLETTDGLPIESIRIERGREDAVRVGDDAARPAPALTVHTVEAGTDEPVPFERAGERSRTVAAVLTRLAGYAVHDVSETVPFLLLDLPGPLAAGVTDDTLAHLGQYPDYLVVSSDHPLASVPVATADGLERG